jgi:23S rRNA pseudouridine1911/1915/1917 synthase
MVDMGNRKSNSKDIRITFEDNHLLVVEKPPNMLTQGDQTGDEDLLTALKEYIRQKYSKPGNVYLGMVHRLDRPAGGVMVFAKTSKAASRLSDQVRTGTFGKTYLAVVHGVPDELSGTLVNYLVKDEATNTVGVVDVPSGMHCPEVSPDTPRIGRRLNESGDPGNVWTSGDPADAHKTVNARKAVLEYTVRSAADGLSLVQIKLHTGRPHQIRVQFAAIGHPLYGDQKYGASLNKPGAQLALWSAGITFTHPTLKEPVSFNSDPPLVYPWSLFA